MNNSTTNYSTIATNVQSRIAEAEKFFNLLYGNVTERKFGYLWTKQGETKATYPFTVSNPDERREMAIKAIELSDAGFDVYYGVNCGNEPPKGNNRFKKEQVTTQNATVTDIDIEGGNHISNETKKYPPTFDVAKSFLPFDVSILVNSGYGLHGLCIYTEPINITDDLREQAEERNKKFLDVIRSRAGEYSKVVDGVGDLPRVLRVPGTFNYKLGKDNAPLCHVVEATDTRFTTAELDEKLNALVPAQVTPTKETSKPARQSQNRNTTADATEYDAFRVPLMLDAIRRCICDLSQDQWLSFISAAKNLGVPYATVDEINRCDPEHYDEQENLSRWNSLTDPSFGIETLHGIAKSGGYNEQDVRRKWYQLHPEAAPMDEHENFVWTQDKIKSCPVNLRLPEDYIFGRNGITYLEPPKTKSKNPRPIVVTRTPVIPTKKFREPVKGTVEFEIAILSDEWHTTEIDGRTLADPRAILNLANYDALILEPKLLCRFFADIISINPELPKIKSYNQTGWTNDDFTHFAFPSDKEIVRRAGFDYQKIFKPKGDAEAWRQKFIEVTTQGGAPARVVIGAAAAAFLVRPLELPNLQVHLHGPRSIGKTPLQKFAGSPFGNPRVGALAYAFGATSPKSRLELACAFRDMPLIAEELESIGKRDAEHLPQDIYNYSLGIGGQVLKKDGTLRDSKIFSGARLTNGEHDITQKSGNAGELKRVLPICCATLLEEDFAAELHGFCDRNHGLFLKQWTQYIIEHLDEIKANFHFALRAAKCLHKQNDNTQLTTLVVSIIAYQHFKIAIGLQKEINNTEIAGDRDNIAATLPTATDMGDTKRAEEFLSSYVAGHEKCFARDVVSEENGEETEVSAWGIETYGKIFDNGEVAILPHKLKEILETVGGFTSADKLIREWHDQGKLIHDKNERTHTIKILKKAKRVYHFRANLIDKSAETTELEYYESIGVM